MVWQEAAQLPGIYKMGSRFAGLRPVSIVTHMIFLAAQLPGIYKMGSRFAGLRPVSIVTHMIFLCVAFHAAFAA